MSKRKRKKRTKEEQFIEKLNRRLRDIKNDKYFGELSEFYVDLLRQLKEVEGVELTSSNLISRKTLQKENSKLILATLEATVPTIKDVIKETLEDEDIKDIIKESGSKYVGEGGKKSLVNLRAAMKGAYVAALQRFYNAKDQLAVDKLASQIAEGVAEALKWNGEKITEENVEKRRRIIDRFVNKIEDIGPDTDEEEFLASILGV